MSDHLQPIQAAYVPPSNDVDDGDADHYNFDQPKQQPADEGLLYGQQPAFGGDQRVTQLLYGQQPPAQLTGDSQPEFNALSEAFVKATEQYEEHQKIAGDDMIAAREKFRQLEEQERLNPNNMLIRILVMCTNNFYGA